MPTPTPIFSTSPTASPRAPRGEDSAPWTDLTSSPALAAWEPAPKAAHISLQTTGGSSVVGSTPTLRMRLEPEVRVLLPLVFTLVLAYLFPTLWPAAHQMRPVVYLKLWTAFRNVAHLQILFEHNCQLPKDQRLPTAFNTTDKSPSSS